MSRANKSLAKDDIRQLSGPERSAILLLALGEEHSQSVWKLMDDDEIDFPFGGTTRFEGMEELPDLLCDPRSLRDGYIEALQEFLVEVRRGALDGGGLSGGDRRGQLGRCLLD